MQYKNKKRDTNQPFTQQKSWNKAINVWRIKKYTDEKVTNAYEQCLSKMFWGTETVSQNTVEPHCITTTEIHKNLALWPYQYSDEIVAVSQFVLMFIKVLP